MRSRTNETSARGPELLRWLTAAGGAALAGLGGTLQAGCGPMDAGGELPMELGQLEQGITYYPSGVTWTYYTDDSVNRIQIKVRVCETEEAKRSHLVDCMVPHGYALIGGGARTTHVDGDGALLREARPLDDYFFRAQSSDHLGVSNHRLTVYAIGIRLLGVGVQRLRNTTATWSRNDYASYSQSEDFPDDYLFSGGFYLNSGRFIQESKGVGGDGWKVTGSDHMEDLDEHIKMFVHKLPRSIIEGFGALEIQQRASVGQYSSGGIGGISFEAQSGWALVGYGGDADTSTGEGRFLYGIGAVGARRVQALSRPLGDSSTGYTTAHSVEARRVSNTHGLCNPGPKLDPSLDECVADVCAADASCCSWYWSSQCVDLAQSVCGKNCSDHSCSTPSFDPDWWEDSDANCYGYAVNRSEWGRPGRASYYSPDTTVAGMADGLLADGLLPSTRLGSCPDNRTKIALLIKPTNFRDFHFMRRDSNGQWSHKFSGSAPRNTDDSSPPKVITNPETAVVNGYTEFGGYFCACSDSQQGEGHTELDWPFPTNVPPWGFGNPQEQGP